ncbi:hypothetical protein POV27_02665 [Aureisphaera galaxeae]|uniref:hypothetical protein n=1 Tax=Aureisphaera galaxeae TaxID=1538023 RepID=UPI002350FDD0|nr:hypothetical protein [Aureisphaera galaxeae]MDC8002934.1 hypothetical protein [Aureisphaera galaxeae]
MFSKANLIATLVAAVWGMGGGFLLWGIIAEPLMADSVLIPDLIKAEPDMAFLALGCLIQAFGFCSIYRKFGMENYGASTGLNMGILVGIMIGLGEKMIDYATANMMDMQGTLMNFVIYVIFFGVTGLIAGLIYQKVS